MSSASGNGWRVKQATTAPSRWPNAWSAVNSTALPYPGLNPLGSWASRIRCTRRSSRSSIGCSMSSRTISVSSIRCARTSRRSCKRRRRAPRRRFSHRPRKSTSATASRSRESWRTRRSKSGSRCTPCRIFSLRSCASAGSTCWRSSIFKAKTARPGPSRSRHWTIWCGVFSRSGSATSGASSWRCCPICCCWSMPLDNSRCVHESS